jgi:very-short-patch-repair endonuclease
MYSRLTELAKKLRKEQTDAEKALWTHLRNRQPEELKFRRQQPIGKYIVDFVCFEKMLVVEIDGGHHGEEEVLKKDMVRDEWFSARGYMVLRFGNHEVLKNPDGVLTTILERCAKN